MLRSGDDQHCIRMAIYEFITASELCYMSQSRASYTCDCCHRHIRCFCRQSPRFLFVIILSSEVARGSARHSGQQSERFGRSFRSVEAFRTMRQRASRYWTYFG